MRRACASVQVHAREGEIAVTLSAGVATSAEAVDVARLIDAADRALYAAKNAGRNTTSIAEDASV
jgi:PleD family two-component response regulator